MKKSKEEKIKQLKKELKYLEREHERLLDESEKALGKVLDYYDRIEELEDLEEED